MQIMTPSIARAARAYLGLTHKQLAQAAMVSSRTVFKLEKDAWVTTVSLERIMSTFERSGIEMHYDSQGVVIGFTFKREAGQRK